MKKIFLFFLIINCAFAKEISFEEALEIAKKNNRSLQIQELTLTQKKLQKNSKVKNLLPTIQITSSYEKIEKQYEDEKFNNSLKAKQTIFSGGEKYNDVKLAKYNEDLEKINLYNEENYLRIKVLESYIQCLYNREILLVYEKSYEDKEKELERQIEFRNLGLVDKTEILKLESSLHQTEGKILEAKNNLITGKLALKTLLRIDPNEEIEVKELDLKNIDMGNIVLEEDIKNTLKNGVQSKILDKNIDIKEAEANKSLSSFFPKINAEYSYTNIETDRLSNSFSGHQDDWEWRAGISFEWDIFNFGSDMDIYRSSKLDVEKLKLTRDEELDNLRKDMINAYNNIFTLEKTVESNRKAFETSLETYNIEKEKYENRLIDTIDYLKAEEDMMLTKVEYYNSKLNYFLAYEKYMVLRK
ncbi:MULTISPECIES: TolC family protein [Fusobacterium]|uniref:TolC family protein n=1 Tax=Fusobacterium TaxID=848 RepID=UPI001476B3B7|nr:MULTISPECIES: TolC family protein [Fusobacterium]NME36757.1 TolC family protein [Fusobacterium sp. FSA-380-WT-3A]